MFMTDSTLVGAQEPAFKKRHGKMSKLQWLVSNTGFFTFYNAFVSRGVQFAVATPPVCSNCASFPDRGFHKGGQAFCGSVGYDCHTDASNPFLSFIFHSNYDQGFSFCPSPPFSCFFSANIRFINFNDTSKPISPRPNHSGSHLVQPRPSRLITAQTQDSFQSQCTSAVLLSCEPPDCSKPHRQRFVRILKDCPRYYRRLVATFRALIKHSSNRISFLTSTARATKSIWPSNLKKVITAGSIRRKRGLEFLKVLGILQHTPRHYMLGLA